jgi:hypothetical protein
LGQSLARRCGNGGAIRPLHHHSHQLRHQRLLPGSQQGDARTAARNRHHDVTRRLLLPPADHSTDLPAVHLPYRPTVSLPDRPAYQPCDGPTGQLPYQPPYRLSVSPASEPVHQPICSPTYHPEVGPSYGMLVHPASRILDRLPDRPVDGLVGASTNSGLDLVLRCKSRSYVCC